MATTILSTPLFAELILPFLLVFVVVFAILQKSKILGEGKKQIDALVALVIGLLLISFGFAINIINSLIPFLAVAVVAILVFMIIYGMTFKSGEFKLESKVMTAIGIMAAVGVVVTLAVATGTWDYAAERWFSDLDNGSNVITNGVFIILILAAFFMAFSGDKSKKGEDKKS